MRILLITLILLTITACGSDPSASPDDLQAAYIEALREKDTDKILALSSQKFNDRVAKARETDAESVKENLEFICKTYLATIDGGKHSNLEVEGDKASISYTKGHVTITLKMLKEDDHWVMDKGAIVDKTPVEPITIEPTPKVSPPQK